MGCGACGPKVASVSELAACEARISARLDATRDELLDCMQQSMPAQIFTSEGGASSQPSTALKTTPSSALRNVVAPRNFYSPSKSRYDVFVSHSKKLLESEDRAVWVADLFENRGLRAFFDRSDLMEITEPALQEAMLASDVCVTVLDPFTFDSPWVFMENLLAANAGIPIVVVYDSDRFQWTGQLDRWYKLYPWVFGRQVIPVTKSERRTSTEALFEAVLSAQARGRQPPSEKIEATMGGLTTAKISVGGSRETQTRSSVDTAQRGMLSRLGSASPSLVVCAFTCTHDAAEVAQRLHELFPTVPMIGCTTCRGLIINDTWLSHNKQYGLGLWGISDDAGTYVTLHLPEHPMNLGHSVFMEVTQACKLRTDTPSFAMLLGCPGDEEIVIGAIQDAIGENTPIIGGSSADNTVSEQWKQIAKVGNSSFQTAAPTVSSRGITIAIAWASCEISTILTSGFRETEHKGTVTKVGTADHGRTILEIDGRPAQKVYEQWSGGAVLRGVEWKGDIASILASTSFCPLGQPCQDGRLRVLHPASMNRKSGAVTLFANVHEGMTVVMLDAAGETMAKSISQSAEVLIFNRMQAHPNSSDSHFTREEVIGALSIFCGGLVLAMDDRMPMAAEQLSEVLGSNANMGVCCFGEQGMQHRNKAMHGNLMFGCILFSNKAREYTVTRDKERTIQRWLSRVNTFCSLRSSRSRQTLQRQSSRSIATNATAAQTPAERMPEGSSNGGHNVTWADDAAGASALPPPMDWSGRAEQQGAWGI